jgi:hypothetical protein
MTAFDRVLIYRFGRAVERHRHRRGPQRCPSRPISTCAFPPPTFRPRRASSTRRNRQRNHPRCQLHAGPDPVAKRRSSRPERLGAASVSPSISNTCATWDARLHVDLDPARRRPVGPDLLPQQGAEAVVAAGAQRLRLPHPDLLPSARARENTALAENRVRLGAVQTRLLAHMAAEVISSPAS